MISLLSYAYDVPVNPSPRLTGLPDWALRDHYDLEAKAPPRLKDTEVRPRMQQMIRTLLADRFELLMHMDNKSMPVYALTIASGGPKPQKAATTGTGCSFDSAPAAACHSFTGGFGHPLNANAIDMDDLVRYIENWTDLPVVNRTALIGLFAVHAPGWLPMRLPPPPPNSTPAANPFAGLPTIFTVLSNLGLELKPQQATLPQYTVERIARPAVN